MRRIVNLAATIFLPENPNPVKRGRILGLGAKIVERGAADQLAAIEAARMFGREQRHYFLDDPSDSLVPAGAATICHVAFFAGEVWASIHPYGLTTTLEP